MASAVPERPLKLRLLERTETSPEPGAWPEPMQNPHAVSAMRAPARRKVVMRPRWAASISTCLEPGAMTSSTSGWTCLPLSISATTTRSRREEFVQEPMQTWWTFCPLRLATVPMLSGLCGMASMGSSAERSMSMTWS